MQAPVETPFFFSFVVSLFEPWVFFFCVLLSGRLVLCWSPRRAWLGFVLGWFALRRPVSPHGERVAPLLLPCSGGLIA